MKLYLYAIIDFNDQIEGPIRGLKGAGIFNIPHRDIGAAVSEADGIAREASDANVIEHEAVVEKLMDDFTVLPVRFQTVFESRDDLLSMMQSYYANFRSNLERLRNKIEFGVKVIWPGDEVRQKIIDTLERGGQKEPELSASPGRRFIEKKFESYRADKELEAKADKFIKIMDAFLGKFAAEKKLRKLKTENLLLDAVYLVERSQERDFRETFWQVQSSHPGLKFMFSGPWPAYNFVASSGRPGLEGNSERSNLFSGKAQSQILAGVSGL